MQKNKIHFDILVLTVCKHMWACTQTHTCARKACLCRESKREGKEAQQHLQIHYTKHPSQGSSSALCDSDHLILSHFLLKFMYGFIVDVKEALRSVFVAAGCWKRF